MNQTSIIGVINNFPNNYGEVLANANVPNEDIEKALKTIKFREITKCQKLIMKAKDQMGKEAFEEFVIPLIDC